MTWIRARIKASNLIQPETCNLRLESNNLGLLLERTEQHMLHYFNSFVLTLNISKLRYQTALMLDVLATLSRGITSQILTLSPGRAEFMSSAVERRG